MQTPRHHGHHGHHHHRHHRRHSAESLLQIRAERRVTRLGVAPPPAPGADFGAYQKSESSSSVLAMIDSIIRDLEKDGQEAEFNEKEAQKDYVEMMNDSAATRAKVTESVVGKKKAKAEAGERLATLDDEISLQKDELMQTKMYSANVHGQCDSLVKGYDSRTEARTGDIDGLKNAKMTLGATP